MIEGLLHGQSVHFAAAVLAGFNSPLQIMTRNLDGHRICDYLARLVGVFDPRGMRKSDPYRPVADHELDVDSVGMSRGNGDDQRLILAVELRAAPLVGGVEVVIHNFRTIAEGMGYGNDAGHVRNQFRCEFSAQIARCRIEKRFCSTGSGARC